jgi:hypothetical protein
MDTPLVINAEDAPRLTSVLLELTGKSVVADLCGRLQGERVAHQGAAAQALTRAIAANIRQEGRHLSSLPSYGWCATAVGVQPR